MLPLGGAEDYLLAAQLYEASMKRWPTARIQMREGARVVCDSMRSEEIHKYRVSEAFAEAVISDERIRGGFLASWP